MKKGHTTTNKRCLVCVTNGSEDIETVSIIDTLRRSNIDVTLAKVFTSEESQSPSDIKNMMECRLMQGTRIV